MYTTHRDEKCKKCETPLVVESRDLLRLVERPKEIVRYVLLYRVILTCPSRLGAFGWFRMGHCRKEITEEN